MWLSSVKFKYKLGYKPCDLIGWNILSSLNAVILKMRRIKFITGPSLYSNLTDERDHTSQNVWIIKCIFKCKVNIVQTHQGCKFYTWMWFGWNFPHYFLPFYPQNGTAISSRQECESGRGKRERREESIQYLNSTEFHFSHKIQIWMHKVSVAVTA